MLTLVKTVKTMCLSDRMDWTIVDNRVMGVHSMNDVVSGMVFKTPGYGETHLMATNHSNVVAFMTLHETNVPGSTKEGDPELDIFEKIVKYSGVDTHLRRKIKVTSTLYAYSVFKLDFERGINNVVLDYRLRSKGIKTVMDFEIHGALVVDVGDSTWHFFNSGSVFVIVGGYSPNSSKTIAEKSWSEIQRLM